MKFLAAVAAAFLATAAPALAAPAPAKPAASKRIVLPTDVRPDRYDIYVAPDAANLKFTGRAKIDLTVVRATDRIVLNAADLTFGAVSLSGQSAAPKIVLDEAQQTAAFEFPKALTRARSTSRRPACSPWITRTRTAASTAPSSPSSRTPMRAASRPCGTSRG
jgi:hypothetical protein